MDTIRPPELSILQSIVFFGLQGQRILFNNVHQDFNVPYFHQYGLQILITLILYGLSSS